MILLQILDEGNITDSQGISNGLRLWAGFS